MQDSQFLADLYILCSLQLRSRTRYPLLVDGENGARSIANDPSSLLRHHVRKSIRYLYISQRSAQALLEARRGGLGECFQRGRAGHYDEIREDRKTTGHILRGLHVQRRLYLPDSSTYGPGKDCHRSECHAEKFRLSGLLFFLRRANQPRLRDDLRNAVFNRIHCRFGRDKCMRSHSDFRHARLRPIENSDRLHARPRAETVERGG